MGSPFGERFDSPECKTSESDDEKTGYLYPKDMLITLPFTERRLERSAQDE
jgi:hypothetical protein